MYCVVALAILSYLFQTTHAAVDKIIPVMLGGDAVLACPSLKTPAPEIVWVGPRNEIISTRGVLSTSLPDRSRYLVIPGSGSATSAGSLIINSIRLDDDGVYVCRDADSLSELHGVNVTVLVSVQSIRLTAPQTPINEGSQVTATCVTEGSKPAPEIIWIKQENDVTLTPRRISGVNQDVVHSNGTVQRTSSLTFEVERSDYLSLYTCRATVSVFSREDVWKPDVYLSPMSPWLQSTQQRYVDGDTAHFQCVTSGSKPVAKVTWFINNKPVSVFSAKTSDQNREDTDGTFATSSGLDLRVSRDLNGAEVTCSVTNSVLILRGQASRNASVSIVVEYPPVVTITSSASEVMEGDDVTFTCSTDSEPPVGNDTVYLALNEKFVPERRIQRISNYYTLNNVSRMDRGQYQCVARNARGTGSSAPTSLHVKFAPVCNTNYVRDIYARLGSVIMVPCPISAYPHDATVTWARRSTNRTLQKETALIWSSDDTVENKMQYIVRAYEDIVCYAKNSVGETAIPCIWKVLPPLPPSPPEDCLVLRLPNTSHQVLCAPGKDGGSPQTFFLRVRTSGAQNDTVIRSVEPRFVLDDLKTDAAYNLTVCAVSQSFPDTPVCAGTLLYHTEPLHSPVSSAAAVGNETMVYIIVGTVFGCCFILALAFLIIFCRRRKGGHSTWNPEERQPTESSGRHWTSGQADEERPVMHEDKQVQQCSPVKETNTNNHDTATADKALLENRSSTLAEQAEGKMEEDPRLSFRSSRSISLPDKIRFQASTKVYVKMPQKEESKQKDDQKGVPQGPEDFTSAGGMGVNFLPTADDSDIGKDIDYHRHFYVNIGTEEAEVQSGNEGDQRGTNKTQAQSDDSRLIGTENQQHSPKSPPAKHSSEYRISDPADHAAFTDMIRQTLEKNRSTLLPKDPGKPRLEPKSPSAPVDLFPRASDSPYTLLSPSPLSASQTSLASDKHREHSDIYDIPKSSSDWQRAMSLLSLSAIGSGVLGPDSPKKEDYVDMTKGWKGGSVPNLDKIGRDEERGSLNSGQKGNYFMVPSNKHAYLNVKYPEGRQMGRRNRSSKTESSSARHGLSSQPSLRDDQKTREQRSQPRRWSSSERKTMEVVARPPGTETLRPRTPSQQAKFPRVESMKLSPAPRLKLRTEEQPRLHPQDKHGRYRKKSETQQSHGGMSTFAPTRSTAAENDGPSYIDMGAHSDDISKSPRNFDVPSRHVSRQRTSTPNDSPSYVKMERNCDASSDVFTFDGLNSEKESGKMNTENRQGAGTDAGQYPQNRDRRLRVSSVQRSPSYTKAVDSRETTHIGMRKEDNFAPGRRRSEVKNGRNLSSPSVGRTENLSETAESERGKGGQYKWLPFSMDEYVIIPTPSPSETSFENCPPASRESYC